MLTTANESAYGVIDYIAMTRFLRTYYNGLLIEKRWRSSAISIIS